MQKTEISLIRWQSVIILLLLLLMLLHDDVLLLLLEHLLLLHKVLSVRMTRRE